MRSGFGPAWGSSPSDFAPGGLVAAAHTAALSGGLPGGLPPNPLPPEPQTISSQDGDSDPDYRSHGNVGPGFSAPLPSSWIGASVAHAPGTGYCLPRECF